MSEFIVILNTCANRDEAARIAHALVEARLAACVAITPTVQSVYRWKGSVEESTECGLTIKTRAELFPHVRDELTRLHSYEVPEILALPVLDGNTDYLTWIKNETALPSERL